MDKLSELLSVLKDKGLNKSYDRIVKDLNNLCNSLDSVKEEVNDLILNIVSEGKYEDLSSVSYIPGLSEIVRNSIVKIKDEKVEEKSMSKIEPDIDCVKTDEVQLEKYFDLTETLEDDKHFEVISNSEVESNSELIEEKQGYNLYTDLNFFTSKKPYKIKIFNKIYYCKNWRTLASLLFKELYKKNKSVFIKNIKNNARFVIMSGPSKNGGGFIFIEDDIYLKVYKNTKYLIKLMYDITDKYLDIYKKDVRHNVEIFLR